MLLMKNWMETRWRFAFAVGVLAFFMVAGYMHSSDAPRPNPVPAEQRLPITLSTFSLFSVMLSVTLAGAGVRTQAPFRAGKGQHGSTHFTLSLPVSRLRLLTMRSGIGALELFAVVSLGVACLALVLPRQFPELNFPALDTLRYAFTLYTCLMASFCISVVLATFLDDVWQMWGSLLLIAAIRGASAAIKIPENFDPFRTVDSASPFITHTIPWGAVAVCLTFAAGLWLVAARIVQTRDY
jgi:hypothetical protein